MKRRKNVCFPRRCGRMENTIGRIFAELQVEVEHVARLWVRFGVSGGHRPLQIRVQGLLKRDTLGFESFRVYLLHHMMIALCEEGLDAVGVTIDGWYF